MCILLAAMPDAPANFTNRTLWTGDNLDILRRMNSGCVDLVYLDPPFNSNKTYAAPIGSEAAGAAFRDSWDLNDLDIAWHNQIAEPRPSLYGVIDAAGYAHGDGMKSYLIMMAVRLIEMERILKDTGSIYLHCDPTASHYLRMLMDAIFGTQNFRNEIIWCYKASNSPIKGKFPRKHDTLLFYGKTKNVVFNHQFTPYDEGYIAKTYTRVDEEGRRYRLHSRRGDGSERRLYLDQGKGTPVLSWWADILGFGTATNSKERTGYPTQKPLALLERIIAASSNPGDLVLDPFCGCATACVAAEKLERQWAGIDISPKAADLVTVRMEQLYKRPLLPFEIARRMDFPARTDLAPPPPLSASKQVLYGRQAGHCAGCGEHFQLRNLTIDHIIPESKGGTDHIENLQLLCAHCNSTKGDRPMEYLRARLARLQVA